MYQIIIVFIVAFIFTIFSNFRLYSDIPDKNTANNGYNFFTVDNRMDINKFDTLSTTEIEHMLIRLAQSNPPKNLAIGAMCYEVAAPPQRIEYVCPVDGEKTIYALSGSNRDGGLIADWGTIELLAWEIDSCRRIVLQITELSVELDESGFCHICSPDIEKPSLGLIITYPDGKVHKVWDVSYNDLVLLSEFLRGSKVHSDSADWETPLKDNIERLQKLLGISIQ